MMDFLTYQQFLPPLLYCKRHCFVGHLSELIMTSLAVVNVRVPTPVVRARPPGAQNSPIIVVTGATVRGNGTFLAHFGACR
jgi:hypothetical protein